MADVGVTPYNTSEPATGGSSLGNLNVYYDVSMKCNLTVGFGQTRLIMAV
jgi:hypothetical protein